MIEPVVERIREVRAGVSPRRSALVAVSGIDASGKGFLTDRIVTALGAAGLRAVGIGVDGWLHLPEHRFSAEDPGPHFYRNGVRFDEMFARLVLPLRDRRSVRLVADYTEETATAYRPHLYEFSDVDVIVLEGVFLLKREFRAHYDVTIWVDCTFETALERALARGQEGLPPATVRAFEMIYFPAQRHHFRRDEPRAAADLILGNDPRLSGR